MLCSPRRLGARTPARAIQAGREAARHYSAAPPLSSGSKSDDRRDDRPAASSPEPADKSRRLWPHPGRLRSPRAAILRRSDSRRLRQKRQHPNDENRDHETSHRPYSHLMSQPRSGVGKNPDPRGEGLGWVRGQWRGWVHRPEPARLTTRLFLRRS